MEQVDRTAVQDFDRPFETIEPARLASALVFSSPHSGSTYPERFLSASRLDPLTLRRSEDAFVDELFLPCVALGAPLLRALFPRAYLDVNREPYELDPQIFAGRLNTPGRAVHSLEDRRNSSSVSSPGSVNRPTARPVRSRVAERESECP